MTLDLLHLYYEGVREIHMADGKIYKYNNEDQSSFYWSVIDPKPEEDKEVCHGFKYRFKGDTSE